MGLTVGSPPHSDTGIPPLPPTPDLKQQATPRSSQGRASCRFPLPSQKGPAPLQLRPAWGGWSGSGRLGLQQWLCLWLAPLSLQASSTP